MMYRLITWCASALMLTGAGVFGQTITGFSPTLGTNGQPVTIMGTGFHPGTLTVKFNNFTDTTAAATATTVIQARVPATATTGPISVKVGAGPTVLSAMNFTVIGPQPYITNFPATAALGTVITIQGVHFTGATSVKFANNVSAQFSPPTTDSQLQVVVPSAGISGPISITTSKGTGVSTNNFYYQPQITSFLPAKAAPGTQVVLTGKNFTDATEVRFNGLSTTSFTINSGTSLTVAVPAAATTGLLSVFVPGLGTQSTTNFVVLPTISGFSPASGPAGTAVTITGTYFTGLQNVQFNGAGAAINSSSPTQIVATVPGNATSGHITVTTTNGTATSAAIFHVPPSIASMAPTAGPVGTEVTINGLNFTNATSVLFNDAVPATQFTVVNNTQILATVPPGASTGYVTVIAPGGSALSPGYFHLPPAITGFSPASGLTNTTVTLFGENFLSASEVTFNGVSANFHSVNNTQLTVIVPADATTGPISITTPAGTAVSAANFVVDRLTLMIARHTNAVTISWTTNAVDFILQSAPEASSNAVWSAVTNTPVIIGGQNTVTNQTSEERRFYRLRK